MAKYFNGRLLPWRPMVTVYVGIIQCDLGVCNVVTCKMFKIKLHVLYCCNIKFLIQCQTSNSS